MSLEKEVTDKHSSKIKLDLGGLKFLCDLLRGLVNCWLIDIMLHWFKQGVES